MIDYSISKLNTIKNIHTTFVVFSIIFIIVCLFMTMINTYKMGECRVGRSNGKLRPQCYSNLYCTATNKKMSSVKLSVGVSPLPTFETVTFPEYDGPHYNNFNMNINYTNTLPASGISFFGDSDLGICTTDNTIYLGSISPFSTIEEQNVFNKKTSSIIYYFLKTHKGMTDTKLTSQDIQGYTTQNYIQYQVNSQQSYGLCVTTTTNGIFGVSPYNFTFNPGENQGPVDAREYYFDVSRQSYINAISPTATNKIISCVDPSIILPCGDRVYNPTKNMWCDSTTSTDNCLSFCAPHTDLNQTGSNVGMADANSGSTIPYQTNSIATSITKKVLIDPNTNNKYTFGRGGDKVPAGNGIGQQDGVYLQDLVFCGGIDGNGNNNENPDTSNRPNVTLSNKMNLGF